MDPHRLSVWGITVKFGPNPPKTDRQMYAVMLLGLPLLCFGTAVTLFLFLMPEVVRGFTVADYWAPVSGPWALAVSFASAGLLAMMVSMMAFCGVLMYRILDFWGYWAVLREHSDALQRQGETSQ